jgi:glycosyltransferase involved in cell wall biosynthesis
MRVLLVHNKYRSGSPGGEDKVFEQEAGLLRAAGHDVVAYTRSNDEMDESSRFDRFAVLAGMQRSRRSFRELSELIERTTPDVAHFHNTFPLISLSAYQACRQRRVPVVQTLHNFRLVCAAATHYREGAPCEQCRPGSPWAAVRHRCYRNSTTASLAVAAMISRNHFSGATRQWVDRYIALGSFAKDRLRSTGVEAEKISIKPNFVNRSHIMWQSADVQQRERPYALFVGRLSPEKAVLSLLRAWVDLRDVPLRVVGVGPDLERARRLADELNLAVDFRGFLGREEVLEQMAHARCLVVSDGCYEAGVPLVIIEAWSAGVPVVAPQQGSMAGLLDGVDSAIFANFHDGSFHRTVRAVWSNSMFQEKISVGGQERWRCDHSPEVSLASLLSIYHSLQSIS